MGEQFFLTLPSNASMQIFPDNTLTHYQTQLAIPIELTGHWECGLSEVFFPRTWYNVTQSNNVIHVIPPGRHDRLWFKVTIPAGHYASGRDLVAALNWSLRDQLSAQDHIKFEFIKRSEKIKIELNGDVRCRLVGRLATMMGFQPMEVIKRTTVASRVFDPEGGVYALYIYSNITEPSLVGDARVPLLRIIPIKGSAGQMVAYQFEKPHYHHLACRQFQTVTTDIRDDTGQPVEFERGKVIVKLHFRRTKHASSLLL